MSNYDQGNKERTYEYEDEDDNLQQQEYDWTNREKGRPGNRPVKEPSKPSRAPEEKPPTVH